MKYSFYLLLILALMGCNRQEANDLKVSRLFGDHMVIQRNAGISVWGWNIPGKKVIVDFNDVQQTSITDQFGKWKVEFPSMEAGGPYEMLVSSGTRNIKFSDILLGDVYLCSGQSNMEWQVRNSNNAGEVIATSSNNRIRHFKVPLSHSLMPSDSLAGGQWEVAGPERTGDFTAVGYFFAKNLIAQHDVPIGLLNSSWGGSRIEPWMSAKTLGIEDAGESLAALENKAFAAMESKIEKARETFPDLVLGADDPGLKGDQPVWAGEDTDISKWIDIDPTRLWEDQGFPDLDGFVWYRKEFELSKDELADNAKVIELGLGQIDDSDYVWINGKKVGETIQEYNKVRKYNIDPNVLKEGKNIILVRVHDTGGGGGIYGDPGNLYLLLGNRKISLTDKWKFRIGSWLKPEIAYNQIATLLYNKMIYPLQDFPVAGVLWYQGESNANNKKDATEYAKLFKDMIIQWRRDRMQPEMPFLYVQLANFMKAETEPEESNWAILRESQSKALQLDHTAQAVIIDKGEANDIHPRNKQDVGYRLSLGARHLIFGEDLVYSGPVYKSHSISDNKIIVEFDHTGSGLVSKDGSENLQSFSICGEDLKFYRAEAVINDNKVEVWSKNVEKPLYVRYAWANNPESANLYNKEGLPASPFRTDEQ